MYAAIYRMRGFNPPQQQYTSLGYNSNEIIWKFAINEPTAAGKPSICKNLVTPPRSFDEHWHGWHENFRDPGQTPCHQNISQLNLNQGLQIKKDIKE